MQIPWFNPSFHDGIHHASHVYDLLQASPTNECHINPHNSMPLHQSHIIDASHAHPLLLMFSTLIDSCNSMLPMSIHSSHVS